MIEDIIDLAVSGKQFLRILTDLNLFTRHIETTFEHQLFNITEAKIETEIEPNGTFNNVRMEAVPSVN